MTKYTDRNYRIGIQKDSPIVAGEEEIRQVENRGREYICSTCRRTLVKLVDYSGENISYFCNFCSPETLPTTELRSKSKISTPTGMITEPAVSLVPEVGIKRKKKEVKGGLKTLQDRGINITHYKEGKG
jgi:hypothetical protein